MSRVMPERTTGARQDVHVDVRRVDWRFLLPDPVLGHVGLAGTADPELSRALAQVAASVAPLAAVGPGASACYDVVVVRAAAARDVAGTLSSVRPSGWLYIETSGRAARACARELRSAGFGEVELHWLWPTAERCKEIVPLGNAGALRAALARRDPGHRLRLRARAASLLAASGALRFVLSAVAVVGRAP
jgi:hypothetical protein